MFVSYYQNVMTKNHSDPTALKFIFKFNEIQAKHEHCKFNGLTLLHTYVVYVLYYYKWDVTKGFWRHVIPCFGLNLQSVVKTPT